MLRVPAATYRLQFNQSFRFVDGRDLVSYHMAANWENPWWTDVLENGPASEFAHFFDIDWHPATRKSAFLQENRVLLPILGDLYGNVLENQEVSLKLEDTGFWV